MPTFGQYETAQRLFLSGVGGLYTLKSDEKKVIKVLQPPLGIWSDERIQEEIDAFRLRAKTQKALAKSSQFWAPIHDAAAIRAGTEAPSGGGDVERTGEPDAPRPPSGGAFAVMDRYERSVQSLIDGRVNVLNADLRHIFTGVIKALLDVRKSGRPHGNLKPSNILLNNSADLAGATVHLADPVADGALTPATGEKDLKDLGLILYHLVNLRPYDGGTVPRTRDWDDLGPNGEDWRKFCNALLDPHTPAEERDIEKALPRIDTWRAKPKKSKAPMLAAASLVFLIIAGVVFYIWVRPIIWPPVKFDNERWVRLNLEYHAWFEDFTNQMYTKQARDKFRKPPYPDAVANLLDGAGDLNDLDPAVIAQNKGIEWDQRLLNPTPRAITPGAGPEATKKAVELIAGIEDALTPEKWPLLTRLKDTADRYEKLGWTKPAEGIRKTIAAARPPELPDAKLPMPERIKAVDDWKKDHPETILKNVDRTIASAAAITSIDDRWGKIEAQLPKLAAGDAAKVPLLAGLQKFVEDLPTKDATEDVTSLATSFATIEELLGKLAAATSSPVDYAALADDPAAKAEPSLETYAALVQVMPDYKVIPDTRKVKDWQGKLAGIKSDMIDLIAKEVPATEPKLAAINTEYTGIGTSIDDAAGIRLIAKNQTAINDAETGIEASLKKIYDDCNNHPSYMNQGKFDAYVALQKARYSDPQQFPAALANAAKPVRDAWAAGQAALVKVVGTRTLDEFRKTHVADEGRFVSLEQFYADVDQALPAEDADKAALLAAFPKDSPWAALAQHVVTDYRESGLAELVKKVASQPDAPMKIDDADYKKLRDASRVEYDQTCRDARDVLTDYATINDRLDHLYLLADEPARGNPTFRDLFAKWRDAKAPILSDAQVAAALKPVSARVTALLAVDDVKDYATILADTQSASPEIALAAWRKLGSVPLSEDTPALSDETKAEQALTADMGKLVQAKLLDDTHTRALTAEIDAQRPIRWRRWADIVSTPDNLKTALDSVKTFNVTLTPQNDAPLLYYQALFALQDQFTKSPKEADLKAPAAQFMTTVNALPATVSKSADVTTFITRMTKSLDTKSDETSDKGAGPQLAGWDVDKSKQDFWIFHSPDHKYTLTFAKLQVSEADSQKTIFLCTTEMPLGLFIDTMNNSPQLGDIDNTKFPSADQQHWFNLQAASGNDVYAADGVRGWRVVQKKFTVNANWLDYQGPDMDGKPNYPDAGTPKPPDVADPIQLISPWSAMFAARLLGCRVESSQEWKAAYDQFEIPHDGNIVPKDVWNLRGTNSKGASWASQQAHASIMSTNGLNYPDRGIYLPAKLLFKSIKGADAKPWTGDELVKLAKDRVTPGATPYANSTLWFLPVDQEKPVPAAPLVMHHLVGNVAEYAFDGDAAVAVIPDAKSSTKAIDDFIAKNSTKLGVIGGSALSPPDVPFNEVQPLNMTSPQTKDGYCDLGIRLAFTAPKESIVDVLATVFKDARDGKPLPGPRVKKG